MATLILSGVGGSTNWLPLVFPLAGIVLVIYGVDLAVKLVKKWKLHHHMHGHPGSFEDTDNHNEGHE